MKYFSQIPIFDEQKFEIFIGADQVHIDKDS